MMMMTAQQRIVQFVIKLKSKFDINFEIKHKYLI